MLSVTGAGNLRSLSSHILEHFVRQQVTSKRGRKKNALCSRMTLRIAVAVCLEKNASGDGAAVGLVTFHGDYRSLAHVRVLQVCITLSNITRVFVPSKLQDSKQSPRNRSMRKVRMHLETCHSKAKPDTFEMRLKNINETLGISETLGLVSTYQEVCSVAETLRAAGKP